MLIGLSLEHFLEIHVVLLAELIILTPLYVRLNSPFPRALLAVVALMAGYISGLSFYRFTDTLSPRMVAADLANFLLPSVLVVSFVAVTVAICEKLGKSFRSTIAAALSIGLVAVIVGPITGFLAGLAIGVGL